MSVEEQAFFIAQSMRVLPEYSHDPMEKFYKAVEEGASVRYYADTMMPKMRQGTDLDLSGLDCVQCKDTEYWVKPEAVELWNDDGMIGFFDEDGKEIEPVLVREIP